METVDAPPKQRPVLLSVLCILTFIGSGFWVLGNLFGMMLSPIRNFFDPTLFDEALEEIDDEFARKFAESAFEVAQKAIEHLFNISFTKFLLYVASLAGAILMFQLKKAGFYLYSAAQVLLIFVAPVFLGFNLFVNIEIMFSGFFVVLFVALYSVNLKYMS